MIILLLSGLGFALSLYAFFLEQKIKKEPTYKPVCDISATISCSKPILSEYGKLFNLPNSVVGMILYATFFLLQSLGFSTLVFLISLGAVFGSLIFAYILYFKIKSLCLICNAIYIINFLLLFFSYQNI